MTSWTIDPRPMEPVYDGELSGEINWIEQATLWDRYLKKFVTHRNYHSGGPDDLLKYIERITLSFNIENVEINVDASESIGRPDLKKLKATTCPRLYWIVRYNLGNSDKDTIEEGIDVDELYEWIAYLVDERGTFSIDISEYDPTPQYMEIGTMF